MSATILPFTGVQRVAFVAPAPEPCRPSYRRGEPVRIHCYDEQVGPACFAATVIRQNGDWIAVEVEGFGRYSAHWTCCELLEDGEDGNVAPAAGSPEVA